MPGEKSNLHKAITCFSFNHNNTEIALSPNSNQILIYSFSSPSDPTDRWSLKHTLKGHDSLVSSIDWSPLTNFIVSVGHDRNGYVWQMNEETKKWEPTLVILRINRAANIVKWSPNGLKFAVGSSAKLVPICRYEKNNDWWVSKMVKKHKSTILSVSWHPNNVFLLTGGCDYKCRIFSTFIPELDEFDESEYDSVFAKQKTFGALLAEIDSSKGWIESVCWSPSGHMGAFTSHDLKLTFFSLKNLTNDNKISTQTIEISPMPFRSLDFVSDSALVAAGHDYNIHLFGSNSDGEFGLLEKIDKEEGNSANKAQKSSGFAASKSLFQKSTMHGKDVSAVATETVVKTRHQNQIVQVSMLRDGNGEIIKECVTCGMDGNLFVWPVKV